MRFKDDKKKYNKIYKNYKDTDKYSRNIYCARYQYQKDIFPALGMFISICAVVASHVSGNENLVYSAIFILSLLQLRVAFIARNASMHLSVIKDIEKEETLKT